MSYQLWAQIGIALINLLVIGVIIPLSRSVLQLRANELVHLQTSLDRIEQKLDQHIAYHLEKNL